MYVIYKHVMYRFGKTKENNYERIYVYTYIQTKNNKSTEIFNGN